MVPKPGIIKVKYQHFELDTHEHTPANIYNTVSLGIKKKKKKVGIITSHAINHKMQLMFFLRRGPQLALF